MVPVSQCGHWSRLTISLSSVGALIAAPLSVAGLRHAAAPVPITSAHIITGNLESALTASRHHHSSLISVQSGTTRRRFSWSGSLHLTGRRPAASSRTNWCSLGSALSTIFTPHPIKPRDTINIGRVKCSSLPPLVITPPPCPSCYLQKWLPGPA